MPTFESLIMAAPAGFSHSCSNLNSFATSDAATFEDIVAKSLKNFAVTDSIQKDHACHMKVVNFIIRSYKSATPIPSFQQMAVALDQNTLLTRECVEKLIVVMQSNQASETPENTSLLSQVILDAINNFKCLVVIPVFSFSGSQLSGKMQNLKWRVGVAVTSSVCKNLSAPYVLLSFDIKELDGRTSSHSCELSYEEFQVRRRFFLTASLPCRPDFSWLFLTCWCTHRVLREHLNVLRAPWMHCDGFE